ncbi:MAG: HVA22/TB2/DP1 family protein, partial [Terriglobus roseus]|nr:HVA22/TB2/DP1 family protein [Terriglobus roseus]
MTTVLFPIFASYKALRTLPPDPSALSPWLMYWVILSLVTIAESYLYFVLSNVPFYPWLRLFAHLYLVLPGQQGA